MSNVNVTFMADAVLTIHGVLGTALPVPPNALPAWHREALELDDARAPSRKKRQRVWIESPTCRRRRCVYPVRFMC